MIKKYVFFLFCFSQLLSANPWVQFVDSVGPDGIPTKGARGPKVSISYDDCEFERTHAKCAKEYIQYLRENKACPMCNSREQPSGVYFEGCFAAGTRIWVENKNTGLEEFIVVEELVDRFSDYYVLVLSANSTLKKVVYEKIEIARAVQGPETKPLVIIVMDNGTTLKLSAEHAVLLANGDMTRADKLQAGQQLVDVFGKAIAILEIDRKIESGDVYNVLTRSDSLLGHIIVSEGLLTGDLRWQGTEAPMALAAE